MNETQSLQFSRLLTGYQQPFLLVVQEQTDQKTTFQNILNQHNLDQIKRLESEYRQIWIFEPEETLGIDTVRELNQQLQYSRSILHQYVIPNFERATPEAQNALLKTLETNYDQAQFWLMTASLVAVLPTIQSRCAVLQVPQAELSLLTQEETVGEELFTKIKQGSIETCILLASQHSERNSARKLLHNLLSYLSTQTDFTPSSDDLRLLSKALAEVQQGANTKLALESAFFGLSATKDHFTKV